MKYFLLIFLIILIACLAFLTTAKQQPYAIIGNVTFYVDVARTPEQQTKGLAIYNSLPLNKGMVFPFEKPDYYAFWMKDMKFPIDIIYIKKGEIVDIFKDVLPPLSPSSQLPVYKPKKPADTVLEINAGLSDKYNFKTGENIKINY